MDKKNELQNRVALVTGANRGLGLETCRQLASQGVTVILSSRNPDHGMKACRDLNTQGLPVHYCELDVTQDQSVQKAFETISRDFKRLDILVNNAGVFLDHATGDESQISILKTPIDLIKKSLETNTYGAIRMIQKFVPMMKAQNWGRIVNVSSGMGQLSEMNGFYPSYRISKTALNAVTRILADELQETPILVNSVCPGWVKTRMGGTEAEISVEEGADTIVWLATLPDGSPSGGFFRKRKPISW